MQTGYNTDVRHRGVAFHVQTEDGGPARPRVITHLFCGGTALATERVEYAESLDAPDLPARVRALMAAQHRGMLEQLASGELDGRIEERMGPDVFAGSMNPDATAAQPPLASEAPRVVTPEPAAAAPPLHELVLDYLVEAARRRPSADP